MTDLPDYSDEHILSDDAIEAQLDQQLESIAIMATIARTPFRENYPATITMLDELRMAQARALYDAAMIAEDRAQDTHRHWITPGGITPRPFEAPPRRDLPEFERVMQAMEEPPPILETDSALIRGSAAVLRSRIERMRSLKAARDNAVLFHALNSLELGLMGLERVAGHAGDDTTRGGGDGAGGVPRGSDGGGDRDS